MAAMRAWRIEEILRDGLKRSGWTQAQLYLAYRQAGGSKKQEGVIGYWIRGDQAIKGEDFLILVGVLNDRLKDLGQLRLPIAIRPQLRLVRDDEATSTNTGSGESPNLYLAHSRHDQGRRVA